MHIVGIVFGVVLVLIVAAIAIAMIVDNTKVLNEQKALRAELVDMQRECDAIGPNPTDEQMAALNARIGRYHQRFAAWQASPFVITR